MRKDQRGFGVVEALLIIVFVGLVAGVAWYIAAHRNKSTSATTNAQPAKTYTDTTKLYTVSYPGNWIVKEAEDCCDTPKDYTKISRGVTFLPAEKAQAGYGIALQADSTSSLAQNIEQGWKSNSHTPQKKTINGYNAEYVRVVFKGDAESYIDDNYLITHGGATVFITFREKYYHQYPSANWTAAQHLKEFNDLVESFRFLN